MKAFLRILLVVVVLLVLPLVTVAARQGPLESQLAEWKQSPPSSLMLVLLLIAALASDILLPVPSGPLITLAGGQLGVAVTAIAAWLGLMLGGLVAFAIAKRWGHAAAAKFASADELQRLVQVARKHDVGLILITRPLPILAEAAVLVAGVLDVEWRRLVASLAVGNAVVAVTFAALGQQAAEQEWMAIAIVLSVVLPLALTWFVRMRMKRA